MIKMPQNFTAHFLWPLKRHLFLNLIWTWHKCAEATEISDWKCLKLCTKTGSKYSSNRSIATIWDDWMNNMRRLDEFYEPLWIKCNFIGDFTCIMYLLLTVWVSCIHYVKLQWYCIWWFSPIVWLTFLLLKFGEIYSMNFEIKQKNFKVPNSYSQHTNVVFSLQKHSQSPILCKRS